MFDEREQAMMARIEKAVTDKVMAELRPLLTELAKVADRGRASPEQDPQAAMTDPSALQKEFEVKVNALRRKLADRIRASEARFLKKINNSSPK
ncbi:hypothetical protein [Segnochrobactrum spirostomi]|uniref:Uncharacterized protein n=1 Tax=Segnochrobactrum spirostomi TaxID=2608987 RepID=A0A6A7Y1W6_9HYPH|nr:hypothetical protein [Segnochrobactrum spirostomi]MQT12368.1 hypothetical protein [Segnochrobactrum spirostomi]